MSFRILSARADGAEWDRVFALLPPLIRDVHYSSAYARIQGMRSSDGHAILAVLEGDGLILMQPFLSHPIDGLGRFDLSSMGYGGPMGWTEIDTPRPQTFAGRFEQEMADWLHMSDAVCEQCRLHPLYAHEQVPLLRSDCNVIWEKQIVAINLRDYSLATASRRIRRAVNKAELSGAAFFEIPNGALEFSDLYDQSMARLGANLRWARSAEYFAEHAREHVGARWFFASYGKIRCALLTIGLGRFAYAQYLGSNASEGDPDVGLDAFLYHRAAQALAMSGYDGFHLGGGLKDGDSLFQFKRGISSQSYSVGSYYRVLDDEMYRALAQRREQEEIEAWGRASTSEWWPAYRREFE